MNTVYRVESYTNPVGSKTITIWAGESYHYLIILRQQAQLDLKVSCTGEHASATIKILCIGSAGSHIQHTTLVSLDANHTETNVTMLSLLLSWSDVAIHGNVTLSPGVSKVSGHLLEENIILGDTIKIRTAPILDVHSSDVSASHGCRVERLDPKRLFYMQSRGLTPSESQWLIVDGYLTSMFEWFEWQELLIEELRQEILSS